VKMAVEDVHVLSFSMASGRLEKSLTLRKKPKFCFIHRLCMLRVFPVDAVGLVLSCGNIAKIMDCEG
jgi:hypothetical protein